MSLCVKTMSLCAPHLKIDVDSTQKMMRVTNISFPSLLHVTGDKLYRFSMKVFDNFLITWMPVYNFLKLMVSNKNQSEMDEK